MTTFTMYPKLKPLQLILKAKMPNPRTGRNIKRGGAGSVGGAG